MPRKQRSSYVDEDKKESAERIYKNLKFKCKQLDTDSMDIKDTLTSEDLKKMLDNILKIVSCPVCYNSLRPPVAVCESGHSTCPDCKAKISICPLCNKSFQNVKNRQFDDILEVIPRLCRFEGCQVFLKLGNDHEKMCGYRKTNCKMTQCDWEGSVQCLADHFRKDHESHKVMRHINENWNYSGIKPCEISSDISTPIIAHKQVFWNHTTNDPAEKIFKISFYCVPIGKIENSFKVTVTLNKNDKKYSTSILILPQNLTKEEENCICLPSSFVQTFINSEGKLNISSSIEKE